MDKQTLDLKALRERIPLWEDHWEPRLRDLRFHPSAPEWNTECGDRQTQEDQDYVKNWAKRIGEPREPWTSGPPPWVQDWVTQQAESSLFIQERVHGLDLIRHLQRDWGKIRPMMRSDLQTALPRLIPLNQDLIRLIINPTSGTTGQPILCPSHPRTQGCYEPLDLWALGQHGLVLPKDPQTCLGIQLCYQESTIVYNTLHSYLGGQGFAKVNIHPQVWPKERAQAYLDAMRPAFLSGDPLAFEMAITLGHVCRPQVLLSTALELSQGARQRIEAHFQAPVCNIYSLNETGPLAYSNPRDPEEFFILPPDIYLEILGDQGQVLGEGQVGEVAVTGGRNPFLPLLRYRTGDRGSLHYGPEPRLRNFSGRGIVIFERGGQAPLNSIDIGRVLRTYPLLVHRFSQVETGDFLLEVQAPALDSVMEARLRGELLALLGDSPLKITHGLVTPGGKVLPYVNRPH